MVYPNQERERNPVDLSIVIVAFNDREVLLPCLESIRESSPAVSYEVIVVDNGSKDGSIEKVQARFPETRIIHAGYNSGYAGGNNIGFHHSRGEYILFLNPDTLTHEGALDELVRFARNKPDCGAVGPNVRNRDGSLQISCWKKKNLLNYVYMTFLLYRIPGLSQWLGEGGYTLSDFEHEMRVDSVSGCCFLCPRQVLETTGGFDEEYFIYCEEIDLCERIRNHGYAIYYTPSSVITHLGGATTVKNQTWFLIQAEKSRRRFFKKHRTAFEEFIVRSLMFIVALRRWFFYSIKDLLHAAGSESASKAYFVLFLWMCGFKSHGPKPN